MDFFFSCGAILENKMKWTCYENCLFNCIVESEVMPVHVVKL